MIASVPDRTVVFYFYLINRLMLHEIGLLGVRLPVMYGEDMRLV